MIPLDTLTGLPDRQALFEFLDGALSSNTSLQDITAVMVIKINQLKQINSELGYATADALICEIAARCRKCLREVDFIARVHGNEFAIVLPNLKSVAQPTLAANKIRSAFNTPVTIEDEGIKVSLTFGIAVAPLDGIRAHETYSCADLALDNAVSHAKSIARYADLEHADESHTFALERELETAIAQGRLNNVFQPIIEIESGQLKSVEMLLRSHDEKRGEISPEDFIPLAEKTNLIVSLTNWAINNGVREFSQCASLDSEVTLAINISPILLAEPHLDVLIVNAAALWGVALNRITVEVTETAIMTDAEKCLTVLTKFHDLEIGIAIDDFGTGYSSLEYMKKLPADILKIDKSFVTKMLVDAKNRQIVQAVINLGNSMGMTVVAEGVEDLETLDTLQLMGCARAQGYYINRPLDAEALDKWGASFNEIKGYAAI